MKMRVLPGGCVGQDNRYYLPGEIFDTDEISATALIASGRAEPVSSPELVDGVDAGGSGSDYSEPATGPTVVDETTSFDESQMLDLISPMDTGNGEDDGEIESDNGDYENSESLTFLEAIDGIGEDVVEALANAGYTRSSLRTASKSDLVKLPHIGYARAAKIMAAIEEGE